MLPLDWSDASNPRPGVPEHLHGPTMESPASLSPDGQWLVYVNAQLGLANVFVRPFPGPGGPWQISSGGTSAVWSHTGRELFYRSMDSQIMIARYSVDGDSFSAAQPRPWSDTRVERFDLMPDDKHAVVIPSAQQKQTTHATFMLNFMDHLRRRGPTRK